MSDLFPKLDFGVPAFERMYRLQDSLERLHAPYRKLEKLYAPLRGIHESAVAPITKIHEAMFAPFRQIQENMARLARIARPFVGLYPETTASLSKILPDIQASGKLGSLAQIVGSLDLESVRRIHASAPGITSLAQVIESAAFQKSFVGFMRQAASSFDVPAPAPASPEATSKTSGTSRFVTRGYAEFFDTPSTIDAFPLPQEEWLDALWELCRKYEPTVTDTFFIVMLALIFSCAYNLTKPAGPDTRRVNALVVLEQAPTTSRQKNRPAATKSPVEEQPAARTKRRTSQRPRL